MTYFRKMHTRKVFFILFGFFVVSIMLLSYKFSNDSLLTFGFSPKYLNIAETSLNVGSYSSQLIYSQNQTVIPEVQREPLYPAILMLLSIMGFEPTAVVILQIAALTISYLLFLHTTLKFLGRASAVVYSILAVAVPTLLFYSSVLYPFSFQLLFISSTLFLLMPLDTYFYLRHILAGVCMGLAIYERGSYILLPLFITIICFIAKHHIKLPTRGMVVFTIIAYLFIAPWLLRNLSINTTGMNQVVGYSLGYTYGNLPTVKTTPESVDYDRYLNNHGSDLGTLLFIEDKVTDGLSYTEADKLVAGIAISKITQNPLAASTRALQSLYLFPSRIGNINPVRDVNSVLKTYQNDVSTTLPTAIDFAVLIGALIALYNLIKVKSSLGLLWGSVFIYTVAINTLPVAFDVRYRGPLDLIIYSLFAYFTNRVTFELGRSKIWSGISSLMTKLVHTPKSTTSKFVRKVNLASIKP